MTVTPYSPKKPDVNLMRRYGYAYRSYVVPTPLLADFILSHEAEYQDLYSPPQSAKGWVTSVIDGVGWREALAREMASILRSNDKAMNRRIWGILNHEGKACDVRYAEAACMAIGLDLDRDTDIPTLPGNLAQAKDLLLCRADMLAEEISEFEIHKLARRTLRIAALIVHYPQNTHRLLPLAPLDCFRAYA